MHNVQNMIELFLREISKTNSYKKNSSLLYSEMTNKLFQKNHSYDLIANTTKFERFCDEVAMKFRRNRVVVATKMIFFFVGIDSSV
jgi:hypothetical protein